MRRLARLCLPVVLAGALVAAPSAVADDASLTATAERHEQRLIDAELDTLEVAFEQAPRERRMWRALLPAYARYARALGVARRAIARESPSTDRGREARRLLLGSYARQRRIVLLDRRGTALTLRAARLGAGPRVLVLVGRSMRFHGRAMELTPRAMRDERRGLRLLGLEQLKVAPDPDPVPEIER